MATQMFRSKADAGTGALSLYRKGGHRKVEGWLLQGAVDTTCDLDEMQRHDGLKGPVCEIGVHHGRLFILLHLLTSNGERSLAIDLFERQDENVDGSGRGSREHLLRNLEVHRCDRERIELLAENSLRLDPPRIVALCGGKPRLFSIDGGHTAEAALNDLLLAEHSLAEGGVVILDDYFNASWPAVSEGTCEYMRTRGNALLPIAIGFNKFFFAKGEGAADAYRRRILHKRGGHMKATTVFNREVLCFETPTLRQRITADPHWQRFRGTPGGVALRAIFKRRT